MYNEFLLTIRIKYVIVGTMKLYNVRTFTKKLKEALDGAKSEEEVYVLRDGIIYKLVMANDQSLERFNKVGIYSFNPRPVNV